MIHFSFLNQIIKINGKLMFIYIFQISAHDEKSCYKTGNSPALLKISTQATTIFLTLLVHKSMGYSSKYSRKTCWKEESYISSCVCIPHRHSIARRGRGDSSILQGDVCARCSLSLESTGFGHTTSEILWRGQLLFYHSLIPYSVQTSRVLESSIW